MNNLAQLRYDLFLLQVQQRGNVKIISELNELPYFSHYMVGLHYVTYGTMNMEKTYSWAQFLTWITQLHQRELLY